MKNEFKAYYQSKNELNLEELWKNNQTIFVFDTNVLINLYRYKKETVDDFIKLVEELKDRVFIPYHVGLEYHRNRLKPIIENRSEINKLSSELTKCWDNEKFKTLLNSRSVGKHPSLAQLLQEISQGFEEKRLKISEEIENISREELHVTALDNIRESILGIFEGKLGKAPQNQKWLDDLYKEGAERYKNEIPPGYKDQDKNDSFQYRKLIYQRKFGDFIIWKQILEYASSKEKIDNIVFITDDAKEDWMYRVNSQGNKIIGARIELVDEYIQVKPNGVFSVYSSEEFIENGNKIFGLEIPAGSIADVKSNVFVTEITSDNLNDLDDYEKKIKALKGEEADLILEKLSLQSNSHLVHRDDFFNHYYKLADLDKKIENIHSELLKLRSLEKKHPYISYKHKL